MGVSISSFLSTCDPSISALFKDRRRVITGARQTYIAMSDSLIIPRAHCRKSLTTVPLGGLAATFHQVSSCLLFSGILKPFVNEAYMGAEHVELIGKGSGYFHFVDFFFDIVKSQ